jgi:predicted alpha/beta hydrolase
MPTKAREIKVKKEVTGTIPKPQTLFSRLKGSGDKASSKKSRVHVDVFCQQKRIYDPENDAQIAKKVIHTVSKPIFFKGCQSEDIDFIRNRMSRSKSKQLL